MIISFKSITTITVEVIDNTTNQYRYALFLHAIYMTHN